MEENNSKLKSLVVGIDASNIRDGGGVTHLVELLRVADPSLHDFDRVAVWASKMTLARIEDRPWLLKRSDPVLEGHYLRRAMWQYSRLGQLAKSEGCTVLFVPGGSFITDFRPIVTMSRNMLPFEPLEAVRFGRMSPIRLKMGLLRCAQERSFRRADGLIFLTQYAKAVISKALGGAFGATALIPHGIGPRFLQAPRHQRLLAACSMENPFRVLYVSILMPYKHQTEVARAASQLRAEGFPIEMRFIGAPWGDYGREFRVLLARLDPKREFLLWSGAEPFDAVHGFYQNADVFVFASSCENLPNILIEAMASGLPIACSNKGPMPEVLGEAGVYFNPEQPADIARALRKLIESPQLRMDIAQAIYARAQQYSWKRCADETFRFLGGIVRKHQGSQCVES